MVSMPMRRRTRARRSLACVMHGSFFNIPLPAALAAPAQPGEGAAVQVPVREAVRAATSRALPPAAAAVAAESARGRSVVAARHADPALGLSLDKPPVDGADRFSTRDFMTMRSIGVMKTFTRADKRSARRSLRARARGRADRARGAHGGGPARHRRRLVPAPSRRAASARAEDDALRSQAPGESGRGRTAPKAMTMAVIVAGPLPLSWGICTDNEVMPRTTAPLVRGKLRAPPLSMLVIPAAYPLMRHTPPPDRP
jgi:hypothetical protein